MNIQFEKRIVIVGHYGSGKTEFALNLAFWLKSRGEPVTIVDMDIVNPYFRTNDAAAALQNAGIRVIAPRFANTNVDVPALTPEFYSAFEVEGYAIFDVGGDDDGAVVLGRFHDSFAQQPYDMLGVVNTRRPLTGTREDVVSGLADIQTASRLRFTGLVNNTNLSYETTKEVVENSMHTVEAAANALNTKLRLVCAKEEIAKSVNAPCEVFPLKIMLKKW